MTPFLALIPVAAFGLWIFYKCRKANVFIWLPAIPSRELGGQARGAFLVRGGADAHSLLHRRPL